MGVGAIGETALLGKLKNLLEIAGQFLFLHIKRAETPLMPGVPIASS